MIQKAGDHMTEEKLSDKERAMREKEAEKALRRMEEIKEGNPSLTPDEAAVIAVLEQEKSKKQG